MVQIFCDTLIPRPHNQQSDINKDEGEKRRVTWANRPFDSLGRFMNLILAAKLQNNITKARTNLKGNFELHIVDISKLN